MEGGAIKSAGLALGGVAHKPWRSPEAEHALVGKPANEQTFRRAAELALRGRARDTKTTLQDRAGEAVRRARAGRRPQQRSRRHDAELISRSRFSPRQLPHRYDGVAKVTGKAKYAAEFREPFTARTTAVRLYRAVDDSQRDGCFDRHASGGARPGVVAVLTPFNAPKLQVGKPQPPAQARSDACCRTRTSATTASRSRWWWRSRLSKPARRAAAAHQVQAAAGEAGLHGTARG